MFSSFLKFMWHMDAFNKHLNEDKKVETAYFIDIPWTMSCVVTLALPTSFVAMHVYLPPSLTRTLSMTRRPSSRRCLPTSKSMGLPSRYHSMLGGGFPMTTSQRSDTLSLAVTISRGLTALILGWTKYETRRKRTA